jgi:hypothetical protein
MSGLNINPYYVHDEPVCSGSACEYLKKVPGTRYEDDPRDLRECTASSTPRLCREGIPCIPALRRDRDQLREQLKAARTKVLDGMFLSDNAARRYAKEQGWNDCLEYNGDDNE